MPALLVRLPAEGEMLEAARAHLSMAEAIASADGEAAEAGANRLMDYLERFARLVIDA
jgi:hypothetical protein